MGKFIKEAGKNFLVETPVGDLEWVMISGQGKLNDLNDKYYYTATLVLPEEQAQPLIDEINEYWRDSRQGKFKKRDPKSLGYVRHRVATGEKDEDGSPIYEETGNWAFIFKTETTYKDGNQKKITVFNAKGNEVHIGERKVGNGSRGRIKGVIRYYEQVADAGVSLYLNAVQLSKFVEYVGGASFDEIEDAGDDAFEGFDDDGMAALDNSEEVATSKPRL